MRFLNEKIEDRSQIFCAKHFSDGLNRSAENMSEKTLFIALNALVFVESINVSVM